MDDEQDHLALSHRVLSVGSVALLSAAAALAFGRVFRGQAATLKLLAAALLSVLVAALLERRGPIVAVIGSGIGLLITATFLVFPKTAVVIFPTPDTFGAIGRALHQVGEQARVQVSPTPPLQPLLLAGVTAVWTAAFAAHALALRSGSPILAAIPPGSLLAFADILLTDGARPSYAALFLMGALAVLFMDGLRRVRHFGPLRPWPSRRSRARLASTTATRGARRVTVVALGAALLIPGVLPGFQSPALLKIDTSTVLSSPTVDPLVSIRASLHEQRPVNLFVVHSDQPAYWRWTALDHFDGTTWTASDVNVTHGQVVRSGGSLESSSLEGIGLDIRTEDIVQSVVVLQDSGDPWLPMAFRPTSVSVGRSSVRYDPQRAAAVPEVGVQKGLAYTVRSELVLPTRRQLDRVKDFSEAPLKPYEQLPANTPAEIHQIALRITAGQPTPFRKLLAIQNYLHGFTYDANVSGATDVGTVLNFLTHSKRGFCQQFATAMAVLARSLGYPARVAVGFTPGRYDPSAHGWMVTTANAHAWVEVLFPGFGWLAFEPTPTRNNPVADAYLAPVNIGACQIHGRCGGGRSGTAKQGGRTNDFRSQNLAKGSKEQGQGGGPTIKGVTTGRPRPASHPYRIPLVLLGILLALALAAFLVGMPLAKVLARRARMARPGPPREVVLAAFRTFAGRAGDLGLGRSDGETLREYRNRLAEAVPFSDGHLDRLTGAVGAAAYSDHDLSRDDARTAVRDARLAIRDIRRSSSLGRRLIGTFRPGI